MFIPYLKNLVHIRRCKTIGDLMNYITKHLYRYVSFMNKNRVRRNTVLEKDNPVSILDPVKYLWWSIFEKIVNTAQKMKFSIKDFFSKCDQIRKKLQIWSHLLKKSLMENFIFCVLCNGF